jgi:hypothetical protein
MEALPDAGIFRLFPSRSTPNPPSEELPEVAFRKSSICHWVETTSPRPGVVIGIPPEKVAGGSRIALVNQETYGSLFVRRISVIEESRATAAKDFPHLVRFTKA